MIKACHISCSGAYATDDLRRQPAPFDPLLKEVDFTEVDLAARVARSVQSRGSSLSPVSRLRRR